MQIVFNKQAIRNIIAVDKSSILSDFLFLHTIMERLWRASHYSGLQVRSCGTVDDILQEKVRYSMDTLRYGIHVDNSCSKPYLVGPYVFMASRNSFSEPYLTF